MDINVQQVIRQWATDNLDAAGPVVLLEDQRQVLAAGILGSLSILDQIWEGVHGRALTEEEKFGPNKENT